MTPGALLRTWALASILVAATLFALARAESKVDRDFFAKPVVVIGSSLMLFAVPADFKEPSGVLADGRPHARFAIQQISEDETLTLLARAVSGGARTIFVEANALAFDFANRHPSWILRRPGELTRRSYELRKPIKWALGYNVSNAAGEPPANNGEAVDEKKLFTAAYPLHFRAPEKGGRLSEIVAEARRAGIEIVLVVPPRSATAAEYMGAEAQHALFMHFEGIAHEWGLPLFRTSPSWPDEYFVDQAHLNARGRARFLLEIAAWWRDRR